jgi:hypothetical protein
MAALPRSCATAPAASVPGGVSDELTLTFSTREFLECEKNAPCAYMWFPYSS